MSATRKVQRKRRASKRRTNSHADEPKPLIHTLHGTGTPNGQSGIIEIALGCTRRWWLNLNFGSAGDRNTNIGSILHGFMELYYTTGDAYLNAVKVRFANGPSVDAEDENRRMAQHLFVAYQAQVFTPKEIGKVKAVEQLLPEGVIEVRDGRRLLIPDDSKQAKRIGDAVGWPDYSLRIDLEARAGKRELKTWLKTRNFRVRAPGLYAWDWKSVAFITRITIDFYRNHPQFIFYQLGRNAAFPRRPLDGMIICLMTKTKKPALHHIFIPPPREPEILMVHAITKEARRVLAETKPPYRCNVKCCYDWNRPCEWRDSSHCKKS